MISKMLEDFTGKRKKPVPRQNFPKPDFQPPEFEPSFNKQPAFQQQELSKPQLDESPKPQQQEFEPTFNEPPSQKNKPPESQFEDLLPSDSELPEPLSPQQQGPPQPPLNVPPNTQQQGQALMPNIPSPEFQKPKKKGLFKFFKK
jgi:hypothetical protein